MHGYEPEPPEPDGSAMKWIAGLVSAVVFSIIVGLLGWIASSVLSTHDQILTLQSQVSSYTGYADRLDKLDRRLSEVEYWQRWHGSNAAGERR